MQPYTVVIVNGYCLLILVFEGRRGRRDVVIPGPDAMAELAKFVYVTAFDKQSAVVSAMEYSR